MFWCNEPRNCEKDVVEQLLCESGVWARSEPFAPLGPSPKRVDLKALQGGGCRRAKECCVFQIR